MIKERKPAYFEADKYFSLEASHSWRDAAYRVTDVGNEIVSPFWASAAVASGVATMLYGP